jgi:L-iditol 2-dehydrogenase
MCEPCAVAIHALSQAGIALGDSVAIFGAGPIGLLAAQIARGWGADKVILVDVDEAKLNFARELGFTYTVNSGKGDPAEYVYSVTAQKGADMVLEAVGVSAALEGGLRSAKAFGKMVLMGNPAGKMEVSQKAYWEILRKQLTLKGTWNSSYNDSRNEWKLAISCMEKGIFQLEKLITHRFPLSDCIKAFELAHRRSEFFVKIMIVN